MAILLLAQPGLVCAQLLFQPAVDLVRSVFHLAVQLLESHVMHLFRGQSELFKPFLKRRRQLADSIHILAEIHDDSRGLSCHLGGEVRLQLGKLGLHPGRVVIMHAAQHIMQLLPGGGMLSSQIVMSLQEVVQLVLQLLGLAAMFLHVGQ